MYTVFELETALVPSMLVFAVISLFRISPLPPSHNFHLVHKSTIDSFQYD